MNINELTLGQLREINAMFPAPTATPTQPAATSGAWVIGENYLIRTVTMIDTGRLVAVTDQELVLEDAAWIADTGRFAQAVLSGEFGEVEPFPTNRPVIINRGSIIDAVSITKLPMTQK